MIIIVIVIVICFSKEKYSQQMHLYLCIQYSISKYMEFLFVL